MQYSMSMLCLASLAGRKRIVDRVIHDPRFGIT